MLMYHADAELIGVIRVVDLNLFPVFQDLPLFWLIQAEQDRHQRRFSCSVFAQQGVDLTFFQLERDIIIGDDAGEPLRNMQHFYCIRR
mgnify:CR=1 FL=1